MNKQEKQKVLRAVNEYNRNEHMGELQDIPEDGIINLACTYELIHGVEREIQVDFDLNHLKYLNYIDGKLVLEEPRDCLSDFINEIEGCNYDDMIRNSIDKGWEIYSSNECGR